MRGERREEREERRENRRGDKICRLHNIYSCHSNQFAGDHFKDGRTVGIHQGVALEVGLGGRLEREREVERER